MRNKIWTETEINFLIEYYGKFGRKYCMENLNMSSRQISHKVKQLNLKFINKTSDDRTLEFIIKARKIHGDKYDYSNIIYDNIKSKLDIICQTHGKFKQSAHSHLNQKQNCPICAKTKLSTEILIKRFKDKHNDKFDYSLVKYTGKDCYVDIICKTHGVFSQRYDVHAKGYGCYICNESMGEKKIFEILTEYKVLFIKQHRFSDCKHIIPLLFDFYLPEHNTCIEFQGEQHYKSVNYWGGEDGFKLRQKRDKIKMEYCHKNNIPLIIIKYDEDIMSKLKSLF